MRKYTLVYIINSVTVKIKVISVKKKTIRNNVLIICISFYESLHVYFRSLI